MVGVESLINFQLIRNSSLTRKVHFLSMLGATPCVSCTLVKYKQGHFPTDGLDPCLENSLTHDSTLHLHVKGGHT